MADMAEISVALQQGRAKAVKLLVQNAIDEGVPAEEILEGGLLHGMGAVGDRFKSGEAYIPDVMIAARAMKAGSELLKPLLVDSGDKSKGKVVLGTVRGDLHDIGKNLVGMMMEGRGLDVIDVGTDVPAERFVSKAKEQGAQIIALSALLTTTMGEMKNVVEAVRAQGLEGKIKVMVGGAPVSDSFCKSIGADAYEPDAATAAETAAKICGRMPPNP